MKLLRQKYVVWSTNHRGDTSEHLFWEKKRNILEFYDTKLNSNFSVSRLTKINRRPHQLQTPKQVCLHYFETNRSGNLQSFIWPNIEKIKIFKKLMKINLQICRDVKTKWIVAENQESLFDLTYHWETYIKHKKDFVQVTIILVNCLINPWNVIQLMAFNTFLSNTITKNWNTIFLQNLWWTLILLFGKLFSHWRCLNITMQIYKLLNMSQFSHIFQ